MMEILDNNFLHIFSPEGRQKLVASLKYETYEDKTYLFQEGDRADGVDLVLEGVVEIIKLTESRKVILSSVNPGDYFGEVAVLDGHGRSTSARARGRVLVGRVPTATVLEVLTTESSAVTLSLFDKVLKNLRRTNDLLVTEMVRKQKLHVVGEMAGSLIHDFRNPLSGMMMAADYLKTIHPDQETAHWCDLIIQQGERMTDMAKELLEYARGETVLNLERTTLRTFFDTVNRLLADILRSRGVEITESFQDCDLEIDPNRLLRVFQNLMSNASDAMNEQPSKKLELGATIVEDRVIFTIRDNGPGIPDVIQSTLFEPFVTHGKRGGTGLGMAIVLKIVTTHKGFIRFDTAPGEGTCFYIDLPQFHSAGGGIGSISVVKSSTKPALSTVSPIRTNQSNLGTPIMPPQAPPAPMGPE